MHFAGPDQRHGFTRRTIGDVGQPRLAGEGKPSLLGSIPRATAGQSKEAVETAGPGRTSYMAYDDAVTESACKFLAERDRQSADKPFALVVGYVLPHCPYICPPELFHYYYPRVSLPQLPVGYLDKMHSAEREDRRRRGFDGLSDVQVRTARAAYYGLVEYHDRLCGRVFDALRRTRFAENTVVVYTSDHGDMAGEHRLWTKSVLYEASVGVPMIWAWPGRFRAGSVVGRVTSLLDIGPTLLELAGAPPMKNVAGRSLSGFLRGGGDVQGWPDDALAECCGYQADQLSRMLREGPWKIIVHHGHDMPQLFNLAEDPQEMRDRSDDPACADVRQRLLRRVREGWDPESIGKSLAQSAERRRATWEKAKAHATPTADYWDMPPDANVFPLNGQAVDDGTVVRDVWAGHFELLKVRIEKSRDGKRRSRQQQPHPPCGQLCSGEPDVGRLLQRRGQGVLRHQRDCRPARRAAGRASYGPRGVRRDDDQSLARRYLGQLAIAPGPPVARARQLRG
jgi:choline-sulfatase